jgi:arylsulfatase A-like enzyme
MHSLTRRDFVRYGSLAGLAALSLRAEPQKAGQRPNLLFVFPDQFRVFALGFMGADPVATPHLDAFARESVVFANAVSNLPICTPYRGMLMTGRWPFQTGIHTNTNSSRTDIFLDPNEVCLPDVLAAQGYECGYIGKYHLDAPVAADAKYGEGKRGDGRVWDAYTPPGPRRHGFSFWHSYGCCDRHLKPHYWEGNAPREKPTEYNEWSVTHETDVAIDFLRRERNRPFALFVAHNPPHPPYQQVPDTYRKAFKGKTPADLFKRPNVPDGKASARARRSVADYFSAVEGVDSNFGRLLHALAETGQDRNTLVVFTSDHGEMMGSQGRMGKGVFYEESLRIPLIMRLPGKLKPCLDDLFINVPDMFPTLLGLLGLGDHVPQKVAGTNHADLLLTGKGTAPTSTFFIGAAGKASDRGVRAVRTDRHTLVVSRRGLVKAMLFDRETDPYQQHDIAEQNPALCRKLLAELNGWLARTGDPWPEQVWPLRSADAFAIHRKEGAVRLDFEPPGDAKEVVAPDGSDGKLITEGALVGTRSLLADSRRSAGRWHEVLHVEGIAAPKRNYELSYRYRVVAAPEKAQFYVVVRSPTTQHRAIRDFWREDDGKTGTRTVRFATESAEDYRLLFGVENQGAVVWDDVILRDLGPVDK